MARAYHRDAVANPFWDWSLEAYVLDGVKERLLDLQDGFGFDANFALWCCWRAREGEFLDEAALTDAIAACGPWAGEVIGPLRAARRAAKPGPAAFYASIKALELDAELIEQNILFSLSTESAPIAREGVLAAAMSNLKLYASLIGAPRRDGFSSALLRGLIDHIFPEG